MAWKERAMKRVAVVLALSSAGLLGPVLSLASERAIETAHLVVSDDGAGLSKAELQTFADSAEETLGRVLAFWSADAGLERLGKIRVVVSPPRRDVYSCVFYWEQVGGKKVRTVGVFGTDGAPQMLAHKLTSAVFPQKDKLIRNIMGILTEAQVGNPLTFPMCGLGSDEWVLALLQTNAFIPVSELGPDHESWGMEDSGGGKLSIHDKPRQHKAYAEAGSFGTYLFETYGIGKLKQLQRRSQEKDRPFQEVFGVGLPELEANWLTQLKAAGKTREDNVSTAVKLLGSDPATACAEAQKLVTKKR
jgi:hypothetical protein